MFTFLSKTTSIDDSQLSDRKVWRSIPKTTSMVQRAQLLNLYVECKSHRKNLKKHKNCFVGSAATKWMVESGMTTSLSDAIQIGNDLLENNFITDVCGDKVFQCNGLYRFNDRRIQFEHDLVILEEPEESLTSDVNLSPSIQLIEDSPDMSHFDLDYDIVTQHRMSSFDTDQMSLTPKLSGTPTPFTRTSSCGVGGNGGGNRHSGHFRARTTGSQSVTSMLTTRSGPCGVTNGKSHRPSSSSVTAPVHGQHLNPLPIRRSMPMLVDRFGSSSKKRHSAIYRDHHNRGGSGYLTGDDIPELPTTTSAPTLPLHELKTPSIALFASTTEHTPEPVPVLGCDVDDDDVSSRETVESYVGSPDNNGVSDREDSRFDLPDIHALEDSLEISEIELVDDSLHIPCLYSNISDSRLVCNVE